MKIYNSQLVMSLVYRSTLQATTMVQRDPWSGRRPLCLASSVIYVAKKKEKRPGLFTSLLSGQNPGETEYRRFERQLINIRQSQTTQLLLHNCPIK